MPLTPTSTHSRRPFRQLYGLRFVVIKLRPIIATEVHLTHTHMQSECTRGLKSNSAERELLIRFIDRQFAEWFLGTLQQVIGDRVRIESRRINSVQLESADKFDLSYRASKEIH